MTAYIRPWVELLRDWLRSRNDLDLENAALRQQLAMYERRRPDVRDSDRLFWLLLARIWPGGGARCSWCARRPSCAGTGRAGGATGRGRADPDAGAGPGSTPS